MNHEHQLQRGTGLESRRSIVLLAFWQSLPFFFSLNIGRTCLEFSGLRLFLQAAVSQTAKLRWTAFLVLVGIGIGVVLPLSQVWRKFCLLVVILPVLGLADVLLLRSERGLAFWIRACGFEVCTTFGVAAATRFALT